MKKMLLLLAPAMLLSLVGCGPDKTTSPSPSTTVPPVTSTPVVTTPVVSTPVVETINTHAEYLTAAVDAPLTIKGKVVAAKTQDKKPTEYFVQNGAEGYSVSSTEVLTIGTSYIFTGVKAVNYQGFGQVVTATTKPTTDVIEAPIQDITATAFDLNASINTIGAIVKLSSLFVVSKSDKQMTLGLTPNAATTIALNLDNRYMSAEAFTAATTLWGTINEGAKIEVSMAAQLSSPASNLLYLVSADGFNSVELTEADKVDVVGSKLFTYMPSKVTKDGVTLALLATIETATIVWSSTNAAIDVATGAVTRQAAETVGDLKASVTLGTTTKEFIHNITVTSLSTIETFVTYDLGSDPSFKPAAAYLAYEKVFNGTAIKISSATCDSIAQEGSADKINAYRMGKNSTIDIAETFATISALELKGSAWTLKSDKTIIIQKYDSATSAWVDVHTHTFDVEKSIKSYTIDLSTYALTNTPLRLSSATRAFVSSIKVIY